MRFLLLILCLVAGSFGAAQAQSFAISKSKYQKCIAKIEPGKEIMKRIWENCAYPIIERECRYGGKNSKTFIGDCPPRLVRQMGGWIKKERAEIRKIGGKQEKEAKRLMDAIGNARNICSETADTGRSMDTVNRDFCRSIVLAQAYGMLYIIKTRIR